MSNDKLLHRKAAIASHANHLSPQSQVFPPKYDGVPSDTQPLMAGTSASTATASSSTLPRGRERDDVGLAWRDSSTNPLRRNTPSKPSGVSSTSVLIFQNAITLPAACLRAVALTCPHLWQPIALAPHPPQSSDDLANTNASVEWVVLGLIAIVSAVLRFWRIGHPHSVVQVILASILTANFDEVHFGKFASYYLRREYFFDVHPPLAKLLLAFAGWVIGHDGAFEFENIGDDYIKNKVPYVALRSLPALLGSLVPPVVYAIMRESGYPKAIAILSASLVLFDNAHVAQTRLILLDAPLVLFMSLAFYCYIRFHKLRYNEFTKSWWTWMILTGVFLSLTISCKMVGLFAFLTVGTCVLIDLWGLLDIKRGHTLKHVVKHFAARAFGLIVVPAIVYLFWFWVHFKVLNRSGTGDEFMSSAFQQTLLDSPMTLTAKEIHYFDTITLQHRTTKSFLHSHPDRYPLKYDDGRISSAGQQVTGYPFNDTNNHWIVEPTGEIPESGRGRIVRHNDIIKLRHVVTNTTLLTHDVACPTMATNTEFTTWDGVDLAAEPNTHFQLEIEEAHEGSQWMSKSSHFKLIHVPTRVALWSHTDPALPDWAFKQQEVNGNKNLKDRTTLWVVDEVIPDPDAAEMINLSHPKKEKTIVQLSFLRKFFELQIAMLQHNAGLTDSHPYASGPINWPFMLSGISFWTGQSELKQQIYLIGNPASWWLSVIAMSVFVGILSADRLAERRGMYPIPRPVRNRLYNSGGFFMIAWLYHYIPFFTMSRQLFLHHYLPAHVCSALLTGAVFQFVVSETINSAISVPPTMAIGATTFRRQRKQFAEVGKGMILGVMGIVGLLVVGYSWFAPLTYGFPGLEPEQVNHRRWLSTWTLHYAK
ncbi:BQ5605_C027g10365 [Microbotryum silenes-dioicae]|uniref:Dolichyl-phosphate-mannose--protein mannosyltransferase n=1 Tax=Microbotryum silenes-dioicae TaxID=796604 RepID=A0A2X0MRG0_9BASI|nr:BQ5605_C027g10365 [Microbotryum silenes-dioicae]